MSAPQLIWRNAGEPAHKYAEEPYQGPCATCAAPCEIGVSTEQINNPTFSNHAEFFRWGTRTHVCRACAWLYGIGKGRPGNVVAVGDSLYRPVISEASASAERSPWLDVLRETAVLSPDTPAAGVLTTDTKPRLWPRMRVTSVGVFGIYVHAPEYGVSGHRFFALSEILAATQTISRALGMGFSKRRVYEGLLADFPRAKKDMGRVMRLEKELAVVREAPEFVPALIVTYKGSSKENEANGVPGRTDGAGEAGGQTRQDGDRLFQL